MRTIGMALLGLILCMVLWLTLASAAFLWLAGLWDNPFIPWWSRPWQWARYLQHGDGSWSEVAYLIVAALGATSPIVAYVRFGLSWRTGTNQSDLYGKTRWATTKQMKSGGISTDRTPF